MKIYGKCECCGQVDDLTETWYYVGAIGTEEATAFVCDDCVDNEEALREMRDELWDTPYPRSSQPLDDEEQESLSVKMDVPESFVMKVARILTGSKS
tara:strand:- start:2457 stop:2747 length:291 start_codon:yes stop_codon:yes gene_type:complete